MWEVGKKSYYWQIFKRIVVIIGGCEFFKKLNVLTMYIWTVIVWIECYANKENNSIICDESYLFEVVICN